jgi:hypothetical protein
MRSYFNASVLSSIFAVGLVLFAAWLAGYMAGQTDSAERITAACAGTESFEFRTFVYECRLTPESQARLDDQHTEI